VPKARPKKQMQEEDEFKIQKPVIKPKKGPVPMDEDEEW